MAAAAYSTDLATITADTAKGTIFRQDSTTALTVTGCLGTLTHAEPTGSTQGGIPAVDTDYFILGVATADKAFNATGVGGLGVTTQNAAALPTDGAFMFWSMFTCPNSVAAKASGGIQCLVGSSVANYYRYYVDGDDTHPYGGWKCTPVNPAVTASATQGTPTTTRQFFGVAYNVDNAVSKGQPAALGGIRFGRCYLKCLNGDVANGYATFAGAGTFNDYNDGTNGWNRLGLMQPSNGSFIWQGLFQIGDATTACDFRDADRNIIIPPTDFVTANFNLIELRNASSRMDWKGVSITKIGTVGRGRFVMVDNAVVNKTSCVFTDMDTFVYQSNATVVGSTYRRTGRVTQGGASMSGCLFDSIRDTTSLLLNSPSAIPGCSFISDGSNHALEYVQTGTGGTYNFTLTNLTFTGYAASDGSSGNEMIYVNVPSGNTVNITLSGFSTLSVRTAGATVNKITGQCSLTINAAVSLAGAEIRIYDFNNIPAGTYGTELDGVESAPSSSFTYSGTQGNTILIQIMKDGYAEFTQEYLMPSTSTATYTVTLRKEINA